MEKNTRELESRFSFANCLITQNDSIFSDTRFVGLAIFQTKSERYYYKIIFLFQKVTPNVISFWRSSIFQEIYFLCWHFFFFIPISNYMPSENSTLYGSLYLLENSSFMYCDVTSEFSFFNLPVISNNANANVKIIYYN